MKKPVSILTFLVAVFVVYAPALGNGLVWDDTALILRDPLIRSWRLIPEGFQHFLFTDATASDFYRPLQRLSYTMEYWAVGVRPALYHFTSILCHAGAALALLLFANEFLRRFETADRRRRLVAFAAALVWAVHPIHTSAVAYVAGRADPLAAFFGFLGLYFGLKSDRVTDRGGVWVRSIAVATLFLCSILSKEIGFLFPLLWLAVLVIQKNWRTCLRWAAVVLAVAVVYASLRVPAQHIPAPQIHSPPPPLVRPIIASRAVAEYAALLVFPWNLHVERDLETHPTGPTPANAARAAWRELETLAGIVLLAAAIFWALRARKRERPIFTLLILAAIAYLPISGGVLLNAAMAEHWVYVPSAFLFLAAGLEIARVAENKLFLRRALAIALPAWLIFLGLRTFARTFDWKDERTFYERTIAAGGDSARMLIDLAIVEMNHREFDAAKKHLDEALTKEPDHPIAILQRGALAIRQQDYKAAHEFLDRAAQLPVVEPQAQELRVVLANKETGQVDLLRMRLASRTGPPNWEIEKRYVRLLAESGMVPAAIAELQATLKSEPYRAESWQLLGELYERTGSKVAAAEAFAHARACDVHLSQRPRVL